MGKPAFTIQLTPELLIKLAPHEDLSRFRKRRPPANQPSKPNASAHPTRPAPAPAPAVVGGDVGDLKIPPKPAPVVPPFLPPRAVPALVPEFEQAQRQRDLEPIRKVLAESEKVAEKLRKQQQADLEEVKRQAKELYEKQYRLPQPRPVPCSSDEQACIQCYKANPSHSLKCQESVMAYVECSRRAQEQLIAAGFR